MSPERMSPDNPEGNPNPQEQPGVIITGFSQEAMEAMAQTWLAAQISAQESQLNNIRRMQGVEGEEQPVPDGYKKYRVETEYGSKDIVWNENVESGIQDMRRILIGIETSPEEGGGRARQLELQRLLLMTDHFQKSTIPEEKRIGERMYKEFMARYTLQSAFLKFQKAGSTDEGAQTALVFTREYLNFFFKESNSYNLPVWRFIQEYDKRAKEYLPLGSYDKLAEFNRGLVESVKLEYADKGRELTDEDLQSAQIIAERTWQMLGRMIEQDVLIDKDTQEIVNDEYVKNKFNFDIEATKANLPNDDPRMNWKVTDWIIDIYEQNKNNPDFKLPNFDLLGNNSAKGANFAFRKDLIFHYWAMTRVAPDRVSLPLLKGFDLGSTDGFGDIPGNTRNYFRSVLLGIKNPDGTNKYDFNAAERKAIDVAKILIGENNVSKDEADPKTGKIDFSWKKGVDLDISEFDFTGEGKEDEIRQILGEDTDLFYKDGEFIGIDFLETRDPYPLVAWVFLKMIGPEGAKKALIDDPKGFFRSPSSESLSGLLNTFAHEGPDQYGKLGLLLTNFGNLLFKGLGVDKNLIKTDRQITDMILKNSGRGLKLNPDEISKAVGDVLGRGALDGILLIGSYFRTDRFLMQFILDLLAGILKESTGLK